MTIVRNPKNSTGLGIIRGYRNPKVTDSTAKCRSAPKSICSWSNKHLGSVATLRNLNSEPSTSLIEVEARKLEHHHPDGLKAKYTESQHSSSSIHVPTFWASLLPKIGEPNIVP